MRRLNLPFLTNEPHHKSGQPMHIAGAPDQWPRDFSGRHIFLGDALDRLCLTAGCREKLHNGGLWFQVSLVNRYDFFAGPMPDLNDDDVIVIAAALLASDYLCQIFHDEEFGEPVLAHHHWRQFRTWFMDPDNFDVPHPNPIDLILEALAKGELRAIGRPKWSGEEWQIPTDFWERRTNEARLVLASCAIDSERVFGFSTRFDSDVFLTKESFDQFRRSFATRLRPGKRVLSDEEVLTLFERYRPRYLAGLRWHDLISELMKTHKVGNRKRIREIGNLVPWRRLPGRQPKPGQS